MLPFAESMAVWGLATLASALVGISLVVLVGESIETRYLGAFGLGLFLWFFVDTLEGSSDLVVGEGFGGGILQALVVILFAGGLLVFLRVDRLALGATEHGIPLLVPLLAAAALGLHGLGEGLSFGSTAAQTSSGSLLSAFGGTNQGAAYVLHKVMEPMMVGALYVGYARAHPKSAKDSLLEVALLALVFVIPSVLGGAVGYFSSVDTTYLFALGAGSSVYVGVRLSGLTLSTGGGHSPMRVAVALLAGFILIYLAALLHS